MDCFFFFSIHLECGTLELDSYVTAPKKLTLCYYYYDKKFGRFLFAVQLSVYCI